VVKTTRREFLKHIAATGAAVAGLPAVAEAAEKAISGPGGKSRVVIATDTGALKGDSEIVQSVIEKMLDRSVARLTGAPSGAAGWKKLFKPEDVVGIKANCLFGKGVSTRPEMAQAVARGLMSAGVKAENIIIWDRSTGDLIKCGFKPNKDGAGVKCIADDGDWGEVIEQGAFKGRITKIISERVTAFVNLPILKTHGMSGISCSLKNHYGSFDNPNKHHGNHCDPAMADFSSIPVVKNKSRLVVVDALRPQYDAGPGLKEDAQWNNYSLMVSADPVAADTCCLEIIQKKRIQLGIDPIKPKVTAWLTSAQERGVGVCDPDKIEIIRV